MKIAGATLDTVTVVAIEAALRSIERTTSGYRPAASVGDAVKFREEMQVPPSGEFFKMVLAIGNVAEQRLDTRPGQDDIVSQHVDAAR